MKGLYRLFMLHGFGGMVRLLSNYGLGIALYYTPARQRARAALREQDLEFDRKWGVETSGKLVPDQSEVVGGNWAHGVRYQAVIADLLDEVLNELGLNFEQFTFIDYGSGKGRAMLIASRFPFKNVIGVEYSSKLIQVAEKNAAIFPAAEKKCKNIEFVCIDATQYPIPKGPLVVFLNNPFGKAIVAEVAKNLETAHQAEPRRIVVFYFNPFCVDAWKSTNSFKESRATKTVWIFDSMDQSNVGKAAA